MLVNQKCDFRKIQTPAIKTSVANMSDTSCRLNIRLVNNRHSVDKTHASGGDVTAVVNGEYYGPKITSSLP